MTGPRDHHRLIRERATSPWATELIETWVKRGGRYLAAAVALWELADPGRGRALGGLVDRIRRELRSALFEVVGRVEGMASFLAGSTSEDRFVVLDGTFYAMRIVSALSDGVACLGRAEALWQVIGEYGAEQLDEILREVCELDGSFPRFDPMNAEALVSNLDLLELWTVNQLAASSARDGMIEGMPAPAVLELLAGARRVRDFARDALSRGLTLELA